MPLRNARPLTWKPKGVSDTIDGTNAFPGAMSALTNLIPNPGTAQVFVPRPASLLLTDFSGFDSPTTISVILAVGTRIYGMIATSDFPGKDVPFCYDTLTDDFVTITGQTADDLPATQSAFGDWTPPTMDVVGNIILVTHPGFPGGPIKFGWIDFSSFSLTSLTGFVRSGSNVILSISGDGTSSPVLDGVQPGQAISAGGLFPPGTTVVSAQNGTFDLGTTGSTTGTDSTVQDIVAGTANLAPGVYVSGPSIQEGAYIVSVDSGSQVTLNSVTLGISTGGVVNFSGGGTITVSNAATGDAALQPLAITGGTMAAPTWTAGDLNVNPLPSVPVAVKNFNGRAYYAVGSGVVFSDSLLPLNRTNASQALTFANGLPATALGALPLGTTAGGIIAGLIVFQGESNMVQITGDPALENLAQNNLGIGVGTLSPNTICQTPKGLAFVSQNGVRILNYFAQVSEPVGANGQGVTLPFINAINPTRMAAAFNDNVLRVSVQNGSIGGQPIQEWWYDFTLQIWTGPHTFPASLIQPFQGNQHGFVMAAIGIDAKLWVSQAIPTIFDEYTENGSALTWNYATSLMPDDGAMEMNTIVESTIALEFNSDTDISITFKDETGTILDTVALSGTPADATIWGSFTWGEAPWGGGGIGVFEQQPISWHVPLVFKQGVFGVTGVSSGEVAIGNIYLRYQALGYMLQRA